MNKNILVTFNSKVCFVTFNQTYDIRYSFSRSRLWYKNLCTISFINCIVHVFRKFFAYSVLRRWLTNRCAWKLLAIVLFESFCVSIILFLWPILCESKVYLSHVWLKTEIHTRGLPHLHPIILPLVPCPFWGYPNDWSQVPSWGYPSPRWGYPRDGVPPYSTCYKVGVCLLRSRRRTFLFNFNNLMTNAWNLRRVRVRPKLRKFLLSSIIIYCILFFLKSITDAQIRSRVKSSYMYLLIWSISHIW